MFCCNFNSSKTNATISINLFWDIWPQTFVLQEEWLCILSDRNYFEHVPHKVVDEIAARFSDITFNYLGTVMFSDILLEEGDLQLTYRILMLIKELLQVRPRSMMDVFLPYMWRQNSMKHHIIWDSGVDVYSKVKLCVKFP